VRERRGKTTREDRGADCREGHRFLQSAVQGDLLDLLT